MAVLQVKNIEKHFGATRVLEDISFELEQGQALAHHRLLRQRKDHAAALPKFFGNPGSGTDPGPG